MKKTLSVIVSLVLVALMSVSVFAAYPASPDWEFPLPTDGVNLVTAGGALIGEATGWDGTEASGYASAFDGDESTFYDPTAMATETAYIGVQMAEPYMLTEIRILPRDGWTARFNGASIQGSNDGENWTTIWESYIEAPAIDFYCFTPTTDYSAGDYEWTAQAEGYTMFRYFNYVSHGDVAEVELYGNPAGGAAAATEVAETPASAFDSETRANLATGKTVTASSNENDTYVPELSVDGDITTRWASAYEDPTTYQVDLGGVYSIDKIIISWEFASSADYVIAFSTDGAAWTDVTSYASAENVREDVLTFTAADAQYIRLTSNSRTSEYGNSIYEFGAYGTASSAAPTEAAPVEAAPVTTTTAAAQTADTVIAAAALCLVAGAVIVISKKSR